MPRYGDDQCANCGGIRVDESTLCADCLVACNVRVCGESDGLKTRIEINEGIFSDMVDEKNAEIEKLKYQFKLTRRILRHVFKEYQELQKLKAADVMMGKNNGRREKINGKNV